MSRLYKLVWTVLVGEYDTESAARTAAARMKLDPRATLVVVRAKEKDDAEVRGGIRVRSAEGTARKKEGSKVAAQPSKRSGRKDRGR